MPWLDFRAVQASVSVVRALESIGWRWTERAGVQYRGECPFCPPGAHKPRCFSCRDFRWQCFRCKRKGNVIGLWAELHQMTISQAARDLADKFQVVGAEVFIGGRVGTGRGTIWTEPPSVN